MQIPDAYTLGRGQGFWQTGAQDSERDAGEVRGSTRIGQGLAT